LINASRNAQDMPTRAARNIHTVTVQGGVKPSFRDSSERPAGG